MTSELKFIGAFLKEAGKNDASRVIFFKIFFSFKMLKKTKTLITFCKTCESN